MVRIRKAPRDLGIPARGALASLVCISLNACSVQVRPLNSSKTTVSAQNLSPTASGLYGAPDYASVRMATWGLNQPSAIAVTGTKLILVDGTHRVLIWNAIPTAYGTTPDVIVGQRDSYTAQANSGTGAVYAGGLDTPGGLCTDGIRLVVADSANNRVLIWNAIPTTNARPADVVLGQPDFISNTANNGGRSAKSLAGPADLHCSSGRLYVSDGNNHRILFWNSIPTSNFTDADGVLGQPNFTAGTANNGGRTGSRLNAPRGLAIFSGKFLVADFGNSRVLVWNTTAPASLQAANYALGQPNLTAGTANNGGLGATSLNQPAGVAAVGTSLYVTDQENNRILVWDAMPPNAATGADRVLGQPDFISNAANNGGVGLPSLFHPRNVASAGARLFVVDRANNRALVYESIPTATFQAADAVIGQARGDLNTKMGGLPPEHTVNRPYRISAEGGHYWVTDTLHHRILRWPAGHTIFDGSVPDLVVGQADFTTTAFGTSATQLSQPTKLASNGTISYVSDLTNSRVLIYTAAISANGAAANAVLGQSDLISGGANAGGLSAVSLANPIDVTIAGTKLIVADRGNHRVLIWNALPTVNTAPDVVLGQPDFTTNTANNGGVSASSFDTPDCVFVYGSMLFVCDRNNNRVLVWNSIPTVNHAPADLVIGQSDFVSNSENGGQGSPNASGLSQPMSVAYNGRKLFIADYWNSRILVWNRLPNANGFPADRVYGQADFRSRIPNYPTVSERTLGQPLGILLYARELWVSDYSNDRLLRFDNAD